MNHQQRLETYFWGLPELRTEQEREGERAGASTGDSPISGALPGLLSTSTAWSGTPAGGTRDHCRPSPYLLPSGVSHRKGRSCHMTCKPKLARTLLFILGQVWRDVPASPGSHCKSKSITDRRFCPSGCTVDILGHARLTISQFSYQALESIQPFSWANFTS